MDVATPQSRYLDEAAALIERHASAPVSASTLDRVTLVRADAPHEARGEFFVPVVCFVVRGVKVVQLGSREVRFEPGSVVASAQDFPITGRITEAPYRAVAINLSPTVMAELLAATGTNAPSHAAGFAVGRSSEHLLDALVRLLRLLDHPEDQAILAPAVEREVLYRALQSPLGDTLRAFALRGHLVPRVQRAIAHIREHVAQRLSVEELAALSNLSTSSFYRHFRDATGSTPLQFQKQIRLQEARQALLVGETNAAGAAARVGYASTAQFSREYARCFGVTPGQDAARRSGGAPDPPGADGPGAPSTGLR